MNVINKTLSWYFSRNSLPYWCVLLADCLLLFISGFITYWAFHHTLATLQSFWPICLTMLQLIIISCVGFKLFSTYSGIMRFSSFVDLQRVALANSISLAIILVLRFALCGLEVVDKPMFTVTQTVLIFIIATLLMWAIRVVAKQLHDVAFTSKRARRVLIYGVMEGGVGLAKSIRMEKPTRFLLKGFISHEKNYAHHVLMGERVYGVDDNLSEVVKRLDIEAVLVSPLRNVEFRNDQELQDILISNGVKIFMSEEVKEWNAETNAMVPSMLKEVSVEDLLPRDEIYVDMPSIGALLKGRVVLITGSAGSIGSEMVRQVASFAPASMILIDQAETPQHDIRLMMAKLWPDIACESIVTSITKKGRMEQIFSKYRPDYVFHAAAYKHVPMMEDNPSESVQNNVLGTQILADISVKYGVKKFVMISTDKAVNPTNVMGCSKRICEIYVQSLDKAIKDKKIKQADGSDPVTQFVTTRFGNVLGSNGSVIPLFQEQIKKGGPVTVTHPDIIRYFMLIPEACKLVLEAGTKGNGGEILVFDMGKPVKIADLAKRMILLSGAKGVKIEFSGLRAGEKLYEEVLDAEENTKPSFHDKIRIATVREYDYDTVCNFINDLVAVSQEYDDMATVRKMKEIVPEYKSNNSVYSVLDKELPPPQKLKPLS